MVTLKQHIDASPDTAAAWAARLGIKGGYLSELLSGKKRPSLALAALIERETGGAVPMQVWVSATPEAAE